MRQLTEWEEYDKLEPIGDWKLNFFLSYLLSIVTNLFIGAHGKKGSKMTKPEEFLIKWQGEEQEEQKVQTVSDMKQVLMALAKRQEGKKKDTNFKR